MSYGTEGLTKVDDLCRKFESTVWSVLILFSFE
jgi:hypothetical protein